MMKIRRRSWRVAEGLIVAALTAFLFVGCFAKPGNHMDWQFVDVTPALATDAGNQKWNTYYYSTVGPYAEQRLAYALFNDDVTMDMWYTPYVDLGKMSLREIMVHHDNELKRLMYTGTPLTLHEYRRDGKVIAYAAYEFQMTVDLWEMAAEGSKVNIRLIYKDLRTISDTGGGSGDQSAGAR